MLDYVTDDRSALAHLLRRATFAPSAAELDAAVAAGYDATLASLLTPGADPGVGATPLPPLPAVTLKGLKVGTPERKAAQKQLRAEDVSLENWWLDRMTAVKQPALERQTFFWHGHYATAISKVKIASWMAAQGDTFRQRGLGAFDDLTLAVVQGAAMLRWLDAADNVAADPNENLGRETMERFTLGVGSYSENDVRDAARALTGWSLTADGDFRIRAAKHDNGIKTILGVTKNFDGAGFISLVTTQKQSARWVTSQLWNRHVLPAAPNDPTSAAVADAAARSASGAVELKDLWNRVLTSAAFTAPSTRGALVAQPVEYVVGALRQLGVRAGDHPKQVLRAVTAMGQTPFDPPSVGGWPAGRAWLTTSSTLARATFAQYLASVADLTSISQTAASGRIAAVENLLSLDPVSSTTASALSSVTNTPELLVAVALCSPEYVSR